MRTVAEEVGDRVPFVPRHRIGQARRDARADAGRDRSRRRHRARDHALLLAAHAGGPVPVVLGGRVDVPVDADRRLQRADPHRRRRRPRDGGPAAAGARQHRRDQGDHQGLRALLAGVPPVRARRADVVGDRAACACRCWRSAGSASSAPSPTSPPLRSPRCTTPGSPAIASGRSICTTGCTRSST